MRAGKLDRTVVVQRGTETVSAAGTVSKTWTTLGELRAELINLAAAEGDETFGDAERTSVTLRTRFYAGITTADRILLNGDFFDIIGIAEIGRRRGLEIRIERAA